MTLSWELLTFAALAFLVIAILGTLGNLLVALALGTSPGMKSSTTLLMINLAASILPICAFSLPYLVVICLQEASSSSSYTNATVMKVFFIISSVCNQVELHTIATLAFNRACAVSCPNFFKKRLNKRSNMLLTLVIIWIYSITIWMPIAFGAWGRLEVNPEKYFVRINDDHRYKVYIFITICFAIPFLFALVCHLIMYSKVCSHTLFEMINSSQTQTINFVNEYVKPWQNQVTKTMTMIFLLLIVCSVPHMAIHIMTKHGEYPKLWTILHILYFSRYALNPVIYVYTCPKYRDSCIQFIRKLKGVSLPVNSGSHPRIPFNTQTRDENTDF